MTISGDDLRRIARLAELDVTPAEIDRLDPTPLERPPADIAPEFQEGFFLVPRLPAMEDG